MKPELQLEYLSPYLPYGLKIKGNNQIEELETLSNTSVNIKGRGTAYGMWADISDIKPLVVPLWSLNNNQWKDVFLAGLNNAVPRLNEPVSSMKLEFEYHGGDAVECILTDVKGSKFNITYAFKERAFNADIRFNQVEAFNELYKLHADVNLLIEDDLAVDKVLYV